MSPSLGGFGCEECGSGQHTTDVCPRRSRLVTSATLSATETAKALGVAERTVRRWIASGELPAEKRGGVFLVDPDDARSVLLESRAGRAVQRSAELAELRGRLAETREQIDRLENLLADERRKRLAFETILYPQPADQEHT